MSPNNPPFSLAFTRTLTILYSTTLLSLFTAIQLSMLGRSKYVQSVLQLERDERMKDLLHDGMGMLPWVKFEEGPEEPLEEAIDEEVEMLYLTLSWWMLHVGWKDIGERVRRGVEEVLDECVSCRPLFSEPQLISIRASRVSLKTKLSIVDLHRLVSDIRRRVEHEITFEGRERRIK
jgi:peroxin-3